MWIQDEGTQTGTEQILCGILTASHQPCDQATLFPSWKKGLMVFSSLQDVWYIECLECKAHSGAKIKSVPATRDLGCQSQGPVI